ncbi:MAG: flippase-like domain-containing protein, partial [Deltaproteobacteria bacterium]|nr:flippase-like domain-containing protein [Deltaproteobacteria bacterium]
MQPPADSPTQTPIFAGETKEAAPQKKSPAVVWLKRIAPWAIAAAIFYYLFNEVPIADAWAAARSARLEVFLPLMMVAVLLWFLIDSAAFAFLFTRFNAKLAWAEARSLRGMTYLLTPINWNLGTAAVILHLRSSKRIGALESTSTMVFYQTIDGMVLATCAALGAISLVATPEITSLRNIAVGFVLVNAVSLAIFMSSWPRLKWIVRVRALGIFRSHQAAVPRDVVVLVLMKGVYFSVFIAVFWLGCHSFGIDLPLSLAVAATPAILMAGA